MPTSDSPQSGIYTQQHAGRNATMWIDDGSQIRASVKATITLPIFSAHIDTTTTGLGPVIASGSVPAIAKITTTTGSPVSLNWASGAASAVIIDPIAIPADYDPNSTATLTFYGEKASGADASAGMVANVFWGSGASAQSLVNIGSSAAPFTSIPSAKSIQLASGLTTAGMIHIAMWPDTHAADAIALQGAWFSYKRRI